LSTEGTEKKTNKINGIELEAQRIASSLRVKKESKPYEQRGLLIGRTKSGLNTKLNTVTDNKRPRRGL
jgi:hypothetical protein